MGTGGALPQINAWFGPAGTVSPLHVDPQDNILVQLVGYKAVLLHDKQQEEGLYRCEGTMTNTSQVDAAQPDVVAFPRYQQVKGNTIVLAPGDALFIPKGTWHYVTSLQPSWSLSFWFD
jgi:[protein]-arginine 3-hydroxylase / protease